MKDHAMSLSLKYFAKSPIARRLTYALIVFGAAITLCATLLQVYLYHQQRMGEVRENLRIIEDAYLTSLANSVWVLDHRQIKAQLAGLLNLPRMEYLIITSGKRDSWSMGSTESGKILEQRYPLVFHKKGQALAVGELRAVVGLDSIYQELVKNAAFTLAFSGIAIFLLAGVMLLIFNHYVTRRVIDLSARVSRLDLERGDISLDIRLSDDPAQKDELDLMAEAVETMHQQIYASALQLREQEEQLRTTLHSLGDAVIATDVQGNVKRMNPIAEKLTGWPIEEGEDRQLGEVFRIVNSHTRQETNDIIGPVLENGKTIGLANHTTLIARDGIEYQIADSASPIKRDDGTIIGMVLVFRDVSQEYRMKEALRESEEKYRALVENANDAIFVTQDQRIRFCNPPTERITGYAYEALAKMDFSDIIHPADQEMVLARAKKRSADRKDSPVYSFRIISKAGKTLWVQLNSVAITWEKNPATLNFMRDITHQKALEVQLQKTQKMESIGNLAGGIAHDFNNILFPIVGISELLLEDLPRDSQEYENVEEILKAGKRGRDLVKQILAFSRQSKHTQTAVRLQGILKEVLKLTQATIPSYIQINQDIASDCGWIMADPTQIHQVAMNLITNAFHAVESDGGTITVRLKQTRLNADLLADSSLEPGRYAVLSIADTGHGIPAEVMSRIFDPYFTTKEQGKGTGLGLSVAYGIIKAHKGEIKVYSDPGRGTTFSIYLPLMPEQAIEADDRDTLGGRQAGKERVLLVDDEASIVRLEKLMLERLGYQVTACVGSMEALEAFKAHPKGYDLVITDMTMPNMTGDELTRQLKAIQPDIPIIICTGFSERINEEKAEAMGVKGFLMKPIGKSELTQLVRTILDGRGLQG